VDTIGFDEKVAIVTGAGGGLGREHALELARRGARVVVNDLGGATDGTGSSASAADAVVAEISEAGGEAVANYDSVSSPEGGKAIVQTALDAFGTVDIVINNAGILRDSSFAKMTDAELRPVIDVHLLGGFYVTLPAWDVMKEKGYGRILFTTSAAGMLGNFGQANYGAAKAGLWGLSNVLAQEGRKYDIRSNAIAPIAKTRMTEELFGPMMDFFAPEQVTPAALYLVSEDAPSGEVLTVGGGRVGRMFLGVTPGWFAGMGVTPSVEDVAAHAEEILSTEGFRVPDGLMAELQDLVMPLFQGGN
jgi:NAD(P)-dependent dehydrogenase (short-subunit alcohol dehydrogenase family)